MSVTPTTIPTQVRKSLLVKKLPAVLFKSLSDGVFGGEAGDPMPV